MKSALRITSIYLVFASLWIVLSDKLVEAMSRDIRFATFLSTVKGILFVIATGLLLFLLILSDSARLNRTIARLEEESAKRKKLIAELHRRIGSNIRLFESFLDDRAGKAFSAQEAGRIRSSLASMEAAFNTVYGGEGGVPIKEAVDEYLRTSRKGVKASYVYPSNALDAETLVSVLLALDTILDRLLAAVQAADVEIEFASREKIRVSFPPTDKALDLVLGESGPFVRRCLEQMGATMELQRDYRSRIVILLPDGLPA